MFITTEAKREKGGSMEPLEPPLDPPLISSPFAMQLYLKHN